MFTRDTNAHNRHKTLFQQENIQVTYFLENIRDLSIKEEEFAKQPLILEPRFDEYTMFHAIDLSMKPVVIQGGETQTAPIGDAA